MAADKSKENGSEGALSSSEGEDEVYQGDQIVSPIEAKKSLENLAKRQQAEAQREAVGKPGNARGRWRRQSTGTFDSLAGQLSLADLDAAHDEPVVPTPQGLRKGLVRRASTHMLVTEEEEPPKPWVLSAALVFALGVASVIPYNQVLAADPGSPLFLSFVTHIFFCVINIHKIPQFITNRKLPMRYHGAIVVLSFTFNVFRSDAFARLPTSLCMLLLNCQMLLGMGVARIVFKNKYSFTQLVSSGVITLGVMWAGVNASKQTKASQKEMSVGETLFGVSELLLALLALTLLSTVVKLGFNKYGECVEEQIFMQHFFSLPVFYLMSSQWQQIGPRATQWIAERDYWKMGLLLLNMTLTFGHNWFQAIFAGRAPNLLIYQLVDTIKKFSNVLMTALLRSPPFPPIGFWGGSAVLVAGTVQFLSASEAPKETDTQKGEKQKSK